MERRAVPRVQVDLPARIWRDVGWHTVRCTDMSLGGLGLSAWQSLAAGSRVRVTVEASDGPIEVVGEVVREGTFPEGATGIRLLDADTDVLSRLFASMRREALVPLAHHDYFDEVD